MLGVAVRRIAPAATGTARGGRSHPGPAGDAEIPEAMKEMDALLARLRTTRIVEAA
jgi:hypothetical protein